MTAPASGGVKKPKRYREGTVGPGPQIVEAIPVEDSENLIQRVIWSKDLGIFILEPIPVATEIKEDEKN